MGNIKKIRSYVWDDAKLSVGVKLIDDHHKKFLDLLNFIIDTINKDQCRQDLTTIFFKLAVYTEDYITDEELYFKKHEPANYTEHKTAHRKFIEHIKSFKVLDGVDSKQRCLEILDYLEGWLETHIIKYDAESVNQIKGKEQQ